MESSEDLIPPFCVGQHETQRSIPISPQVVQRAHESNYDMLTTAITTTHFHSRVLTLLSSHLSSLQPPTYDSSRTLASSHNTSPLTIPPLSPDDSPLTPNASINQLVAISSSWIDLCSPDPLIADISRQILTLEIAYAAFCGVSFVIIPGPRLHHGSLHVEGLIYYARAIHEILSVGPYIQIHIWLRMVDNPDLETDEMGDLAPFARAEFLGDMEDERPSKVDLFGILDAWDVIRKICKYHSRLFVALSLPKYLPPMPVQCRWYSEPVHILTIEAVSFIKNAKGYPVLSKAHQAMISRFMKLRTPPWIILCNVGPIPGLDMLQLGSQFGDGPIKPDVGSPRDPTPAEAWQQHGPTHGKKNHDPTPHLSYMRNLQQKLPPRTPIERFGIGYQDYLQAPLQPLTVNLESITYEVFEKDPIKYEWYERAIAKALRDWEAQKKPTSSGDGRVVVAIVGAGRGPLVTRALRASAETGVSIDVWAVEKNPNAYVLLERHNEDIWGGCVNLVKADMRTWRGPHREVPVSSMEGQHNVCSSHTDSISPPFQSTINTPIDILVSELLGSFGDNELSPECLDGVTHLLNSVHGISIPASYSAHLSPISAPRLHAEISTQMVSNPAAPETPYVVMLHAVDFLSTTQPRLNMASASIKQPGPSSSGGSSPSGRSSTNTPTPIIEPPTPIVRTAWSFSHPNKNIPAHSPSLPVISNSHNVRQARLTFPCRERGVCHGLAGYFEAVLYEDIELSTNPVTMDAKSEGMISWFPIYFPLKSPLSIPENSNIVVTMYRQTDNRKVWYEWVVEVFALEKDVPAPPSLTPSHLLDSAVKEESKEKGTARSGMGLAKGPRRVRVAMSDLHSSIKDGCLM